MNKNLINKYIKYLNNEIEHEEDLNELDALELKRDALTDLLDGRDKYSVLGVLELGCPDKEVIGQYECLGIYDGYTTNCRECWKRILNI